MSKKSKKRRREREEKLEEALAKIARLEKKLEQQNGSAGGSNLDSAVTSTPGTPTTDQDQGDKPKTPDPQTGEKSEQVVSDSEMHEEQQEEASLQHADGQDLAKQSMEWLDILGEDPTVPVAVEPHIEEGLLKRLEYFCKCGMDKQAAEALLKQFACAPQLAAPKLNPQVSGFMKDYAIARDKHMVEIQGLATLALSIIASVATSVYEANDGELDFASIVQPLTTAAKILALLAHKQNINRKAFIEPGLPKKTLKILKDTKVEEFLYGDRLTDQIKDSNVVAKQAADLKPPAPQKPANQTLNQKAPFAGRPGQMGRTYTGGHPRPKLSFRNRQQFSNPKARAPQQAAQQAAHHPQTKKADKKD